MKITKQLKRFISGTEHVENKNEEFVGRIVISQMGRDRGTYNIIMSVSSEPGYVYIANGRTHRVQQPKKKKLKHVELTEYKVPDKYIYKNEVRLENGQARAIINGFFENESDNTDE